MLKKEIKTKQELIKLLQSANIKTFHIEDVDDDVGINKFFNEIKKKRSSSRKTTLIFIET